MSIVSVRAALETALNNMTPSLQTAWENVEFITTAGTPYQRVKLLLAAPENPSFGGSLYREHGFLSITLAYPLQVGVKDAQAMAELIRTTFARGNSFTNGGINVIIDRTPEILQGFPEGDRYVLPVRVRFFANIIN